MHPAPSIIVFNTASAAGFGLLALLGLLTPLGVIPAERWLGLAALGVSLGMIAVGLLASTFHLTHPERAWRAVTQWRSSWLSREGVAAIATCGAAGLFAVGWVLFERVDGVWLVFALAAAALAAVTVVCTSMIYASLSTVRQWHTRWTAYSYAGFAAMTGFAWLHLILRLFGEAAAWAGIAAAVTAALGWALKVGYWRVVDNQPPSATPESATRLGFLGRVRQLDPPHTEENYLLREMAFRVGRKHAAKLRRIAVGAGGIGGTVLSLLAVALPGASGVVLALLAVVAVMTSMIIERWLFFAEATHTMAVYYQR